MPINQHHSRPENFYKTLVHVISQATNLGVVAMSASVKGVTVDMLRHILQFYVREETIKAASAEIVNHHRRLPSAKSKGRVRYLHRMPSALRSGRTACWLPTTQGTMGIMKRQLVSIRCLGSMLVLNTQAISCNPREALYVLDGLLENNTILKIREHTTDTHGYTEIVFALCYLLGYYFMPRIRDLKDQQLYRVFSINVWSPTTSEPMGQLRLLDRQNIMLSTCLVNSFTSTFEATAALNILAPSM